MAADVETGPAVGATVSSDDMEIIAAKLLQGGKPFNPIDGLDEKQVKALNELRQIMQPFIEGDPKWKAFCDDMCLCRYLRARNWNVGKAEEMLKATLEWRREYKPEEILSTDVESQIRSGHMFQMAFDKFGRPAVCLKVHTKPDPHDRDEKLQFMIYSMERAIRRMDANRGVEKMLWLVCCEGYNMKYNGEIGFAKELLSILQNHYPERLGALVIYDAPFVFRAFWKIIYPFIDKKTQKKVTFLSGTREPGGQIHNFVNEWFDASELAKLEKYFGGTMETPFDADAYMAQLAIEESREAGGGEHHKKRRKRHRKHKKHHTEPDEEPHAEDTAAAAAVAEHPEEPHVEVTEETPEHHPGEGKQKKKKKKHKKKAHHPAEETAK